MMTYKTSPILFVILYSCFLALSLLFLLNHYYVPGVIIFLLGSIYFICQPKRIDFFDELILLNFYAFKKRLRYSEVTIVNLKWTNSRTGWIIEIFTDKRKYSIEQVDKYFTADLLSLFNCKKVQTTVDEKATWIKKDGVMYEANDFYSRTENEIERRKTIKQYCNS